MRAIEGRFTLGLTRNHPCLTSRILPWGPHVLARFSPDYKFLGDRDHVNLSLYLPVSSTGVLWALSQLLELTLLQKMINLLFIKRISVGQRGKFFLDQSKVSPPVTGYTYYFAFFLMIKNSDRILFLSIYKEDFLKMPFWSEQ